MSKKTGSVKKSNKKRRDRLRKRNAQRVAMGKKPIDKKTPRRSFKERFAFLIPPKIKFDTIFVCTMGMLIAAEIILERVLGGDTLPIKINFAFVAVAVAAYLYGPIGGALCYGLGDIIGTFTLSGVGGYNPLFTLTNVLVGICFGYFFMGKITFPKILIPVLLERTVGTLLINTFWLKLFYIKSKGYFAFMLTRIPESVFFIIAELIILPPLLMKFGPQLKKLAKR